MNISIYKESLERMERMIEMGFKEGISVILVNSDDVLAKLTK